MKLKDRIMQLHDGKRSTREIADLVYGEPATRTQMAYARIVIRQRKGGALSPIDKKYLDTGGRVLQRARSRVLLDTGEKKKAAAARRDEYRRLRLSGLSWQQANPMASRVYSKVLRASANLDAARRAGYDAITKYRSEASHA